MKYQEQFFSTFETIVRSIGSDVEISDTEGEPDADGDMVETTLTLSASELSMGNQWDLYENRVVMNPGRENIAKLMFHYDIPIVHNETQAIDGEAMLKELFEKLSQLTVAELAHVFINLNISFTYTA